MRGLSLVTTPYIFPDVGWVARLCTWFTHWGKMWYSAYFLPLLHFMIMLAEFTSTKYRKMISCPFCTYDSAIVQDCPLFISNWMPLIWEMYRHLTVCSEKCVLEELYTGNWITAIHIGHDSVACPLWYIWISIQHFSIESAFVPIISLKNTSTPVLSIMQMWYCWCWPAYTYFFLSKLYYGMKNQTR